MVQNGICWTIGEHLYFLYCPIISYQRITVYRVETMDIGISHWNNGVTGKILMEYWCSQHELENVGQLLHAVASPTKAGEAG